MRPADAAHRACGSAAAVTGVTASPERFSDLEITATAGGHAMVRFDDTQIVVRNAADSLTAGDFLFL